MNFDSSGPGLVSLLSSRVTTAMTVRDTIDSRSACLVSSGTSARTYALSVSTIFAVPSDTETDGGAFAGATALAPPPLPPRPGPIPPPDPAPIPPPEPEPLLAFAGRGVADGLDVTTPPEIGDDATFRM